MKNKSATVHWVQLFAAIVLCMLRQAKNASPLVLKSMREREHMTAVRPRCHAQVLRSAHPGHSRTKLETLSSLSGTFGAGRVASSIHCHLALGNPQSCTWDSSTVMTTVRGSHVEISMPFGLRTNSERLCRAMVPKCLHLSLFLAHE